MMLLPLLWVSASFSEGGVRAGSRSSRRVFNNVLPFSLIVVGQTYIPSGSASILNATTPLFTVVGDGGGGRGEAVRARVAGVVVGLVGVVILRGERA